MGDVQHLIPQNKFDLKRAQAAVEVGYPAVAPILPELLEWLQDYNWPVAHILAPFLASIGEPLVPHGSPRSKPWATLAAQSKSWRGERDRNRIVFRPPSPSFKNMQLPRL